MAGNIIDPRGGGQRAPSKDAVVDLGQFLYLVQAQQHRIFQLNERFQKWTAHTSNLNAKLTAKLCALYQRLRAAESERDRYQDMAAVRFAKLAKLLEQEYDRYRKEMMQRAPDMADQAYLSYSDWLDKIHPGVVT